MNAPFPYPDHRTQAEVIADEAIARRARDREREMTRERCRRWRERKAFLELAWDLPYPEQYAKRAPSELRTALLTATLTEGGYRVPGPEITMLRQFGLADVREPFLTAFGIAVRRFVMEGRRK